MANSRQAKKRVRQAEYRRNLNAGHKSEMRTYIKDVIKAVEAGNKEKAVSIYKLAVPMLDKMATKKVITKNKAARHKSRLNLKVKSLKA